MRLNTVIFEENAQGGVVDGLSEKKMKKIGYRCPSVGSL